MQFISRRFASFVLLLGVAAVVPGAVSPVAADPPWIYGMHDPGGESIPEEQGKRCWILFTERVQHNPSDFSGKDFRYWTDRGHGAIVRINNGYGSEGTIPYVKHYDDFAQRVKNYVAASPGAHIWIIGNETNLTSVEAPAYEGWKEPITASNYVQCFLKCRTAIKSLSGHAGDQVVIQANSPWNGEMGNPITYFTDILNGLNGRLDGIALHTYTSSHDPNKIYLPAPEFGGYKNYMNAIPAGLRTLPVYLTESDPGARWDNVDNGWVRNAYGEINWWNTQPGNQQILAFCLYRWPNADVWGIQDLGGVQNDWRGAISRDYRYAASTPPPSSGANPTGDPTVLSDGTLQWESEDYTGGISAVSGVDYGDTDSTNQGGAYRSQGVDIQACSEGGYNVGWIYAGEWLRYKFTGGGTYQVSLRYSAPTNASGHVEVDGANVSGSISLPATGGWQTWATASGPSFTVASAAHFVRFVADAPSFNVNWLRFKPAAVAALPDVVVDSVSVIPANPAPGQAATFSCVVRNAGTAATPSGVTIGVAYLVDGAQVTWGAVNGPLAAGASVTVGTGGGTWSATSGSHTVTAKADDVNRFAESNESNNTLSVSLAVGVSGPTGDPKVLSDGSLQWEAEDYTGGTAAVSGSDYYDTTAGNSGGQYRTQNVDIESCAEGGYNVGWIAAGEWMRYRFTGGGTYQISVRYAAPGNAACHIEVDGANVSGAIPLAATGGWQTWATATANTITLASASHTVRFVADASGFNVNYVRFKPASPPSGTTKWSTDFEPGQTGGSLGQKFSVLFSKDVSGPADGTVGDESVQYGGAKPFSGAQQNRIMGSAGTVYAYAYFNVADVNIPLATGDKLYYSAWFDAQPGGHPIGVDLQFSDGTWMRDGGFVDQNGTGAHPNQRNGYATRVWLSFSIDLSEKAGKSVTKVVVAYDNGVSKTTGVFRAYVDAIRIGG